MKYLAFTRAAVIVEYSCSVEIEEISADSQRASVGRKSNDSCKPCIWFCKRHIENIVKWVLFDYPKFEFNENYLRLFLIIANNL